MAPAPGDRRRPMAQQAVPCGPRNLNTEPPTYSDDDGDGDDEGKVTTTMMTTANGDNKPGLWNPE